MPSTSRHRRTSPPSRACSAACCCPRTPSPTSSRSSSRTTSTGPVHATVFDTILDLYGRGEPADAVTVAAALSDSGDLQRIGGVPYLHTLIESVPTAANAVLLRPHRLPSAPCCAASSRPAPRSSSSATASAGNGGRDVDDIVDLAQQAIYDVTERRVSEDFAVLADMLQPTLDEIEAVGAHGRHDDRRARPASPTSTACSTACTPAS